MKSWARQLLLVPLMKFFLQNLTRRRSFKLSGTPDHASSYKQTMKAISWARNFQTKQQNSTRMGNPTSYTVHFDICQAHSFAEDIGKLGIVSMSSLQVDSKSRPKPFSIIPKQQWTRSKNHTDKAKHTHPPTNTQFIDKSTSEKRDNTTDYTSKQCARSNCTGGVLFEAVNVVVLH